MYDFSNIQKANSKVLEKRNEISLSTYEQALSDVEKFNQTKDFNVLRQASSSLISAIQQNKEHAQSYFLLGYIFYILDNNEFALKYVKKGENLLDEVPEEINNFRIDIEKSIAYLNMSENINSNIQMLQQTKVVVPKKSSFWKILSGK